MAQIAVTALSLSDLSRSHWVARGFLVFSLTAALMAVYYATTQQRTMGRLLTARQVRLWIRGGVASPAAARIIPRLDVFFSRFGPSASYFAGLPSNLELLSAARVLEILLFGSRMKLRRQDPEELVSNTLQIHDRNRLKRTIIKSCFTPAVASVVTLSAPQMVLTASLIALIIALGVYLGFTWTRGLDIDAGLYDSRNVFIMYAVGLTVCIIVYSISRLIQDADTRTESNILEDYLHDYVLQNPAIVQTWGVNAEVINGKVFFTPVAEPGPLGPATPTRSAAAEASAPTDSGAPPPAPLSPPN